MKKDLGGWFKLELVDHEICITMESDNGRISAVRRIRAQDAFLLGLMLTCETVDVALTIDVRNLVSLQIENRPYERAWVRIGDGVGRRTVGCVEGAVVLELGRCLHRLHVNAKNFEQGHEAAYQFPMTHCFVRSDEAA